jgi:hypothetical protein
MHGFFGIYFIAFKKLFINLTILKTKKYEKVI